MGASLLALAKFILFTAILNSHNELGPPVVSSGKLCAGVAKIWLFGPHSACSLIQPKLFASFISASSRSVVLLRY